MKPKALLIPDHMYRSLLLLTDEECGKFLKALFEYYINDQVTEFEDLALEILFMQMKNILDYNNERYTKICQKRSEVAKKRWQNSQSQEETEDYSDIVTL